MVRSLRPDVLHARTDVRTRSEGTAALDMGDLLRDEADRLRVGAGRRCTPVRAVPAAAVTLVCRRPRAAGARGPRRSLGGVGHGPVLGADGSWRPSLTSSAWRLSLVGSGKDPWCRCRGRPVADQAARRPRGGESWTTSRLTTSEQGTSAAGSRGAGGDSRPVPSDVYLTALQPGPRRLVGVSRKQRGAPGPAVRGSRAGVSQVDVANVVRGVVGVHLRLRGRRSLENSIGGRGWGLHRVSPPSAGESPRSETGDSPREGRGHPARARCGRGTGWRARVRRLPPRTSSPTELVVAGDRVDHLLVIRPARRAEEVSGRPGFGPRRATTVHARRPTAAGRLASCGQARWRASRPQVPGGGWILTVADSGRLRRHRLRAGEGRSRRPEPGTA